MTVELISKKDLLKQTNISYGQLYRWKRKNLIPEEWFIKKSVSTGQETFFPRDQILERIEKIIELKDQVSLDELADIFSEKVEETKPNSLERHVFDEQALMLYQTVTGGPLEGNELGDFLVVKILQDYVLSGEITLDEGKLIHQFLHSNFQQLSIGKGQLILVRYLGNSLVLGTVDKDSLVLSDQTKCILKLDIMKEIEQLKLASIKDD